MIREPFNGAGAMRTSGVSLDHLDLQLGAAREESREVIARGDMTYLPGSDVVRASQAGLLSAFESNPLYERQFPQIIRFEHDLVTTAAELFHASAAHGSVTSGGTESIILAVLAARERFRRKRGLAVTPSVVLPFSAHPAFWKAAHLLGLEVVETRLDGRHLPDVNSFTESLDDRTALAVGSAPSYPTGRVEPIAEMAAEADRLEIPFHVDACLGGYFLPFSEQLGAGVAMPDFRIAGVTSISADLHKFGYAAMKGTSILLHRDQQGHEDRRWHFSPAFRAGSWYATDRLSGSRSGGPVAAAWAVQRHLGIEGFLRRTEQTLELMADVCAGIEDIPSLRLVHDPDVPLISWTSDEFDVLLVAQYMAHCNWVVHADEWPVRCMRNLFPWGMRDHLDAFLEDLSEGAALAARGDLVDTAALSY